MIEESLNELRRLAAGFYRDLGLGGFSVKTVTSFEWGLGRFAAFLATRDEADVRSVTRDTLYAYQTALFGTVRANGRPLSLATQQKLLGCVRVFFRYLVKRGAILGDPAAGLDLPRLKRALPRGVMTVGEVRRLLNAPDCDQPYGLRDRAILEVLYSTGIRNAELRNLAVYDVNLADGELRIREGKGGRDRMVPLGEIAAEYVDAYLREARPVLARGRNLSDDVLFVGQRGNGKLHESTVNRDIVGRYAEAAGIKKHVTPHTFRHTCATHLLKGHASVRHIQALLGHKSLDSTQIYTRVEVGDLKRELRRCHPRERAR